MRGGSLLAWHVRGAAGPQCDRHELLLGVKADEDELDSSEAAMDASSSSSSPTASSS